MWILPKNYPLSSAFAAAMVESKEDLSLQGLNIESSLTWRSKPTALPTWLRRWKRVSWLQHLFTRTLKPSHRKSFETALTSSLAVTPANHFQQQDNERVQMTSDTSGHISDNTSKQLDLLESSLKTSKAISRLDSTASSATWKKMVTEQRGEYSQRVKLAHHTNEKEFTSWPTATVFDVTGGSYPTQLVNGQWRSKHSQDPDSPWYGEKLKDAVETAERMWATPTTQEVEHPNAKLTKSGRRLSRDGKSSHSLNLADQVKMWPTPTVGEEKFRLKGNSQASHCLEAKARKGELDNRVGQLNPEWVEALMGVPPGWTSLDGASNKWINGWHDGSWEQGIPRVVDGCDNRVNRIRCLGNGVVPQTAARAWEVLAGRISNDH